MTGVSPGRTILPANILTRHSRNRLLECGGSTPLWMFWIEGDIAAASK
jgi:hypothetical protein